MPSKQTIKRAKQDKAEGKSGSTQAGEFVREEMHHIREGKHGARSAKQAIAIGLSKARRAGVEVEPGPGASAQVRHKAAQDSANAGQKPNPLRAKASERALKDEPRAAASHLALSRHAHAAAAKGRKSKSTKARPRKAARRKAA